MTATTEKLSETAGCESSECSDLLCVADGMEKPYGVEDSCDMCEFCMTADAGGTIGGQLFGSRGTFQYCELGYWREDT